jgi:subtilisin family serine protease
MSNGAEPDNLVCVGMTNLEDAPVCWGNVGQTSVDVFAPGVEMWSTVAPETYTKLSGTSMATPLVAAGAALYKALDQMT